MRIDPAVRRFPGWARRLAASVAIVAATGACATRTAPPAPTTLAHPDFVYPAVPPSLVGSPGASRVDAGWRYLQANDLRNAQLEFDVALDLGPTLYPAHAGRAYVSLARGNDRVALDAFDAALAMNGQYVPALVGRGQALLSLERDEEALAAFESALDRDATLTELGRLVEVLRFRVLQDVIDEARAAAGDGRTVEARVAYGRAIDASPESAFLHLELGVLEQDAGDLDAAVAHLRRAVELDPDDAVTQRTLGEALEARGEFAEADAAFRNASSLDPAADLGGRAGDAARRAREAELPVEFQDALTAGRATRGDLAALIGVRLGELVERAPEQQVVVTDAQDHWASSWIGPVANAGIIEAFENHTFQPYASVRRGDLATVVSRLVDIVAVADPELRRRLAAAPPIADMTPAHLQYRAVSTAVAAGVLALFDDGTFQVGRDVSGAEAVEAIDRVRALAAPVLGTTGP
jgi:tetratricopeptide (TPR) repeat protein